MILAAVDTVAPVEEAREMFERIVSKKLLLEFPGEHYEALGKHLPDMVRASIKFFKNELAISV
jgi:hemoglobin-like flavoprotein